MEKSKDNPPAAGGGDYFQRLGLQDLIAKSLARVADERALLKDGVLRRLTLPQLAKIRRHRARIADLPHKPAATPNPRLSFILGTYNRLGVLQKCIASIRAEELSLPREIVVVDGGSTDGTIQWLVEQKDIISIVHHNRLGNDRLRSWGWFMNLGFKLSHGDQVFMLSDDCLVCPGSVKAALERLAVEESAGRNVGGVACYFRNWPVESRYYVQKTIGGMLMVNHGLLKREALEAVGFCEEDAFSFYKCDSDLSLKIWRAGYEIIDAPNALIEHLFLPDEQLRLENNLTLKRDRATLHELWSGIYGQQVFSEMYQKPERIFTDAADRAGIVREFDAFIQHR